MLIDGGPWVQMAVLCERAIEDKEGVLTIVRVVDRCTLQVQTPQPPDAMPPVPYSKTLVISLKAGSALGRCAVDIHIEGPDGITTTGPSYPVVFESPDRGQNLIVPLNLVLKKEGVYWFNILLDGEQLLTRIPLRMIYAPVRPSAA